MCVRPLLAWQCANRDVVFVSNLKRNDIVRELSLPCGQCIECRLNRSRKWAMRCMHEASVHEANCFVTLTYRDDCVPHRGQLVYADYQKFMRRVRKQLGPVSFYMCGEYGEKTWRPHFHACLFGLDFPDKLYYKSNANGDKLYSSDILNRLWPYGYAIVGDVTFQSAAYVARYCVQKVTGQAAESHYARVDAEGVYQLVPEFNRMSLKPGIGKRFLELWKTDIYPHDYVIVNGVKCPPPRYYDKILKREDGDVFEDIVMDRERRARLRYEDEKPDRLAAREAVMQARASLLVRGLEEDV